MSEGNNNQYSKPEASREPFDAQKKPQTVPNATPHAIEKDVPPGYSKTDGTLSPALFIIVSGGIKRERQYFQTISDINTFPRIKVDFIAKNKDTGEDGLSPRKMFFEAVNVRNKYAEGKPSDVEDLIYLVADVDEFMDELLEIKPKCESETFNLIISNPCFEVWLYYGEYSDKPIDFIIPEKLGKISKAFKRYIDSIGCIDSRKAIFNIDKAIVNAKNNFETDCNDIPVLFSTNMFLLAEKLTELITPELNYLKNTNKPNIQKE